MKYSMKYTAPAGCRWLIGLVICGAAAFITIIQPVSRVSFKRHGDGVSARAHTLLFMVVPFRPRTIDSVVEINEERVAARAVSQRSGPPKWTEEQGFLVIRGNGQTMQIPVSAAKLQRAKQRALDFLADPSATELEMTVFPSWLPAMAGALFSVIGLLYVLGMVLAIGRGCLRLFGLSRKAGAQVD